jgi:outer membrane protein assembly factor BamA
MPSAITSRVRLWPAVRRNLLPGTLAAAFCLCSVAYAQLTPPPGYSAKILTFDATGSKIYSSADVSQLSGLAIGATVDRNAIQAGADRLGRSGLFTSVRYSFATDVGGLHLTFTLEDAPALPVLFDNFPWFTDDELAQALEQSGIPFHGTAPASGAILDSMAQALQKALTARNIQATVSHTFAQNPLTGDDLVEFRVAGSGMRIGAVQFRDSLAANDPGIRSQASSLTGKPFSRLAVEKAVYLQLRQLYLSHAFLRSNFGTPQAELSGNPQNPLPKKDIVVVVPIQPGASYNWGGATWSGNHIFSSADLDNVVKTEDLAPAQPADGMKIQALWDSLRAAYGHRGYLDAQVEPAENFDDSSHQVSYRVGITEGIQYHMGNLVLSGLNVESEQRIRQAWHLAQGQVFDQAFYEDFLARGIAEALKGLPAARDKVGRYLQKNPQQGTVDVLLDFE